jgi:predicted 3-demethylubiquinone-9 3-methyltransferase (glyoxalase superfamily)
MQKITPFLWFNNNAEEAINFYTSVFEDAKIGNVVRNGKSGPGPEGALMTAEFQLQGQKFIALNGGPMFTFSEAVSFVVSCNNQEEVDYYWDKLTEGGEPSRCGWLKDQFGLWWQVVPSAMAKLMAGGNAAQTARVMQAMMQMTKIEIGKLEEAFNQGEMIAEEK